MPRKETNKDTRLTNLLQHLDVPLFSSLSHSKQVAQVEKWRRERPLLLELLNPRRSRYTEDSDTPKPKRKKKTQPLETKNLLNTILGEFDTTVDEVLRKLHLAKMKGGENGTTL